MNDYIKQLEQQNEELQKSLAKSQEEVIGLTERITIRDNMDPCVLFIEKMSNDFNYRMTMKMWMKTAICKHTPLSQDRAMEITDAIMYAVFKQGRG